MAQSYFNTMFQRCGYLHTSVSVHSFPTKEQQICSQVIQDFGLNLRVGLRVNKTLFKYSTIYFYSTVKPTVCNHGECYQPLKCDHNSFVQFPVGYKFH